MNPSIISTILLPLIRHGLTLLGGWLVATGAATPEGATTINSLAEVIMGIVVFLIGLAWSWIEKVVFHKNNEVVPKT